MRKTKLLVGAIGCLATLNFAGAGLAQSAPAAPQHAPAQPKPSTAHAHQQGMDHGGQQMHDQMIQDHQAGMQKPQGQQGAAGMAGMSGGSSQGSGSSKAGKPKSGCCKMPMKKAKPAAKKKPATPMADKPMSDM